MARNAHQGKDLILYFNKKYEEKYQKKAPLVNINTNKWSANDIVEQLGMDESKKLVEYYFILHSESGHTFPAFMNSYDKVHEMLIARRKRDERSRATMERTRILVEEWEKKNGESGTRGN